MNSITMKLNADHLIQKALAEDITSEDITTNAVMPDACPGEVELICKQDGIICGLDVFMRVFSLLDENTEFDMKVKDGDKVTKGQLMGIIKGDIRVLLSGERTALNYLQRMSGIATYTRSIADQLQTTESLKSMPLQSAADTITATIFPTVFSLKTTTSVQPEVSEKPLKWQETMPHL